MGVIKKTLVQFRKTAVRPLKWLKLSIKRRLGWLGVPVIVPYIGFGNTHYAYISGSIMEDKGLAKPNPRQSKWLNFISMIKRYVGDEIPNVRVAVNFMGKQQIVKTNQFGIFRCQFNCSEIQWKEKVWHQAEFVLLDKVIENQKDIKAIGDVMIINNQAEFGVISDVDDTFLVSHSTNTIKKLRLMLFKNALTRMPFEGIAAFFQALQRGMDDLSFNPFFFVSSSEWNLYDLLIDFCVNNNIPKGAFLLQEKKINLLKFWKSGQGKHDHKYIKIRTILNLFKDLNFILIGDSGQKDAEIYSTITKEFPGRIKVIYIRDIHSKKQKKMIQENFDISSKQGVDMLLVANTKDAAIDAANRGIIRDEEIQQIIQRKEWDKKHLK